MTRYSDFQSESLQVTGFVPGGDIRPQHVLREALATWGDTYDGDPISLPGSEGFPPIVPSAILASKDGRHRLEVARSRVNIYRIRSEEDALDLSGVSRELISQLSALLEEERASLARLGIVLISAAEEDHPASQISQHFLQERWSHEAPESLRDLQIHRHDVINLDEELLVNLWLRVKTAMLLPSLSPVVVVEQDINTLEDDLGKHQFTVDFTQGFVEQALARFDANLVRLFPAKER